MQCFVPILTRVSCAIFLSVTAVTARVVAVGARLWAAFKGLEELSEVFLTYCVVIGTVSVSFLLRFFFHWYYAEYSTLLWRAFESFPWAPNSDLYHYYGSGQLATETSIISYHILSIIISYHIDQIREIVELGHLHSDIFEERFRAGAWLPRVWLRSAVRRCAERSHCIVTVTSHVSGLGPDFPESTWVRSAVRLRGSCVYIIVM